MEHSAALQVVHGVSAPSNMPGGQPTDIGSAWQCGANSALDRGSRESAPAVVSGMQAMMIRDARFTGEPEVSLIGPSITQTAG